MVECNACRQDQKSGYVYSTYGEATMYRMYFRDAAGISGRVDFDAEDDRQAMTTAELLADACSDRCSGFELWQDTRQLCDRRTLPPLQPITLSELTERRQAIVIETEETIKNSVFVIANSRRLLERLESGPLSSSRGHRVA
jgi:hypothetical protein